MKEARPRGKEIGLEETARPESVEATRVRPDERLDTVGLYCPIPIIKTQTRMRTMAPEQVLEVLSDDRVILIDMPAWCRSTGNEYLGHYEDDGEIHLLVRKKQRTASSRPPRRG
jgi:tRNA 2-thiouridine synthesizing protein A